MSKPEDIPQDVMDLAKQWHEAIIGMQATGLASDGLIPTVVARAILAERERCAHIAYCAYDRKTEICTKIVRKIRSGVER